MDTVINIELGFKLDGVFFGYHDGVLYQLPYSKSGRYYSLRILKKKNLKKSGWAYYRIRRKKFGVEKIKAMLETVSWQVNIPPKVNL